MTAPPSPGGVFLGDVTALRPTMLQPHRARLDLTFEVPSHEVLVARASLKRYLRRAV